jgi:transketolase N-terminal domain/subunit
MWPYVNGVALANPGKTVFCLGSDGSQQEGNDAEAARFAVAQHLNVKVLLTTTMSPSPGILLLIWVVSAFAKPWKAMA